MRSAVFYGWYIVAVCFLIALFSWGLGFYGPGIYLIELQTSHGWSTSLISSAVTAYYLVGATLTVFIGDAFARLGPRRVVLLGVAALGMGVVGLTVITQPWQAYAAFLLMAVGWAAMSGAAINTIIAPWFERKRGLAISLALNGASCGGVVMVPFLLFLIARYGLQYGLAIAVGAMGSILVPSVLIVLRRHPDALGLRPDGEPAMARSHLERSCNGEPQASAWRRTALLRTGHFWTIAIPFAFGLTAQVGFLTHQIAYLEPFLGHRGAGWAVSLTTGAAVIGRVLTGLVIDHLNRRRVSAVNFLCQAIAVSAMIRWPTPMFLYGACVVFGLGVGNLISLPGLLVQDEFPKEVFGKVISLIVALNQFTFAFGPGLLGLLRDTTGSYTTSLALCVFLQTFAAAIVLMRSPQSGQPDTIVAHSP